MKKRGLSEVITTLIFILLAIIAIGIVWYVFNNIVNQNESQISLGKVTNTAQINDAKVGILESQIKITNNGRDKMTGVKIFLSDGTNTNETNYPLNLGQYESTTITIPLTSGFQPTSATVTPVYGNIEGQTAIKDLTQDYSIEKNNGLVAYYKLNGDAKDSSGNGNDGKIMGSVNFVQGKVGNAAALNGIGWVNIAISSQTNFNEELTYIAWVNLNSPALIQTYSSIIDNGWWLATYPKSWIFYTNFNNLNAIEIDTQNSAGQRVSVISNSGIQANTWYFVAGSIKKNNKQALYVNNNQYNSSVLSYSPGSTNRNIGIGAIVPAGDNKFDGIIDEVMIFNRSLSYSEIQQIYNSQK